MIFWLILEIIILIFIFVPTAIAFLYGAPFIPTPMPRVLRMLELAELKPGMKAYELGCGDGRLVHHAIKIYNARAVGFELSPLVYAIAKIRQALWRSKDPIRLGDIRRVNLSDAHAVFFFLLPEIIQKLKLKFERELASGTKIISYAFAIDGWKPIYIEPKVPEKNFARILVYEIGKHR